MRRCLLVLVAILAGCPPAHVERPYAPPTAAELVQALQARAAQLRTLRADARVDHMGDGGERVKLSVAMLLERGGKLRLEAESPLGGALATLVSDGQRFQLLDVRANRFLVGAAEPCNVARLIRVWLSPDDVVQVLMGGAPLGGEPTGVRWDPSNGGREVLELRTPDGGRQTISLDARERRWDVVAAERKDAEGKTLWRLEHDDFQTEGGVRLPMKTYVEEPPHHADVKIRYRSVEPNVATKPEQLHLEPGGLKPEPVTCEQ
jgi:hypothetical protein